MIRKTMYLAICLACLSTLFVSSCKKEINTIGVDIVGENPLNVLTIDTITVEVHSELIDSLRTDELTTHLVGAYRDPVFGLNNASVYTQFRLSESTQGFDFGSNAQPDSLVLYVKYKQYQVFGDTLYTQHLSAYELDEELFRDTSYYAFQTSNVMPDKVGQADFVPIFDTVKYVHEGDTLSKIRPITIRMTDDMALRMLQLGNEAYADNEGFLKAFKGLLITTDESQLPASGGSMLYADFNHVETFMRLYYHNDAQDSLYYDYIVNNNTARYSHFNHYNYADADADFRAQLIDKNTALGAQKLYLQGMGGVRTVINFPYIDNLPDRLVVNEARLYVSNLASEQEQWPSVSKITMTHPLLRDNDTLWYQIPDAASGELYFGGYYMSATNGYSMRITQEVQNMITNKISTRTVRMKALSGAANPAQLMFGGPQHPSDKKLKLRLVCTSVPE